MSASESDSRTTSSAENPSTPSPSEMQQPTLREKLKKLSSFHGSNSGNHVVQQVDADVDNGTMTTDSQPKENVDSSITTVVDPLIVEDDAAEVELDSSDRVSEPTQTPEDNSEASAASTNFIALTNSLKSSKIMIVDDEKTNILVVQRYLKNEGYREFITTTEPQEAMKILRASDPDVVLLDINMPRVSGIDILRTMSIDPQLQMIPTVILTASTDPKVKQMALNLGANDFLTKPVDPHDLIPRVRNALLVKSHVDQMADQNLKLEELVNRRTAELYQSRQQLILSLARAAEHRDNETSNHVIRVGRYAGIIARELGWSEQRSQMLEQAAQLHDVGKIGIPDAIMFKPGKLDPQEYAYMKKHCILGKEIIEPFSEKDFQLLRSHARIGGEILHMRSTPMMVMAARIAQTHHERWDGSGYPLGLAGDDIPIEGRITAVADVFDALSSARSYKKAFPREKCFAILEEGRDAQFDGKILDAFFARHEEIVQVQLDFTDNFDQD